MTALIIFAAALLALGTLATAADAMTDRHRPAFIAAGALLWCAAGVLAVVGAVASLTLALVDGLSNEPLGISVLNVACGLCVATAAVLLLKLFSGLRMLSRCVDSRRNHQRDTDEVEQ